ncbi:MAG: transglycosylase domain-containing protein [Kiloniellaceae bacterium]
MVSVLLDANGPKDSRQIYRDPHRGHQMSRGWRRVAAGGSALLFVSAVGSLAIMEAKTSTLQAEFFSKMARQMTYQVGRGPSDAIIFPDDGPYDRRLGYVALPGIISTLQNQNYAIERQARISQKFDWYFRQSGIAPYRAKTRSGLTLVDRDGKPIFISRQPERTFETFDSVPTLIVKTLLFIENRELLDPAFPRANPAVEWDRLATAFADLVVKKTLTGGQSPGGSTLATQMEKFRHSPYGRTESVSEKLRQMISASLRGYLDGRDTTATRRRIVVDYLNSTPLAARTGYGEVIGLGDGLWAWFGTDFATLQESLSSADMMGDGLRRRAAIYRQALSLLIAQRRPSEYLITGRDSLHRLVDSHLRLLAGAGVIDTVLRDAALAQTVSFTEALPAASLPTSPLSWKAASTLRARLLGQLGIASFYDLDRLDLTAETTLDREVQEQVTAVLKSLSDPTELEARGLAAPRLLDRGAPEKVIYSLMLFEKGGDRNYLRLQADNYDGPFDINEGTKLDLGSTAKLRTLVSYLQIVGELHDRFQGQSGESPRAEAVAGDPLTRWVAGVLAAEPGISLRDLLRAAMQRRYSASPKQTFFTGGGLHSFVNFDKNDDDRVMSVAEALRNSVNLVFIRLMRDIVSYHVAQGVVAEGNPLDRASPLRQAYLSRFADWEGREFLLGFYGRYRNLDREEILAKITNRARRSTAARAVLFRSLRPEAGVDSLASFLRDDGRGRSLSDAAVRDLFKKYAKERFSLNDRGYIAKIHPLELWLAAYLSEAPHSSLGEVVAAGAEARQDAYAWLFRPKLRRAQDRRIRILLEEEAFQRIAAAWQQLGYPFDWLVPSYATAIGSSGDRPAALAELMGIIANEGQRLPTSRFERLRFGEGTPFETVMKLETNAGERVLHQDVALTLRQALIDTVEEGTGRRVSGAFQGSDGAALIAGGKTGTGDHRYERFGRNGEVISSKVVNRTATFVFFLGDRFFGAISAHVAGAEAEGYGFTSALPTQLLKSLAPTLQPLLNRGPKQILPAPKLVARDIEALPLRRAESICNRTRRNGWHCSLKKVIQASTEAADGSPIQ